MGNSFGKLNELLYTSRYFYSEEAKNLGIISHIYDDTVIDQKVNDLINNIISNSPLAVQASKMNFNYLKNKIINKGLDYNRKVNMSFLQCVDLFTSKGSYPKL